MEQEQWIECDGQQQAQSGKDPDNYSEEHTKQDDCLLSIKCLNIVEKLGDGRCAFRCRKSALRDEV